jgi:hypothetical protein
MTEQPQEKQGSRGSRKASIAGWAMIILSVVILSSLRLATTSMTMESFMTIFILTFVVFSVGAIILVKYGRRRASGAVEMKYPVGVLVVGLAIVIIGFLFMFVVITLVPYEERTLPFIFSLVVLFAGLIIICISSVIAQMRATAVRFAVPASVMDSFRQIEPEKSFETKRFNVLKKGDIYILLPKTFTATFFIRAFTQTPTSDMKFKPPLRFFRKRNFTDEIGGLPVMKAKGEYNIPVGVVKRGDAIIQEKYAKVSGIAYIVPKYDVLHRRRFQVKDLSDNFNRDTILKIIEQLSKEETGSRAITNST